MCFVIDYRVLHMWRVAYVRSLFHTKIKTSESCHLVRIVLNYAYYKNNLQPAIFLFIKSVGFFSDGVICNTLKLFKALTVNCSVEVI